MERLGLVLNNNSYLCALSPQTLSPIPKRNLNLFFLKEFAYTIVYSCGGLLCFDSLDGRLVLCNLTTQQLKFLPPTPRLSHNLDFKRFIVSGFGYDSISDDYKVVRVYEVVTCELIDGSECLGDNIIKFELYSLRSNSWKEILAVDYICVPVMGHHSASVNGCIYWIVSASWIAYLLEFNLATETFSSFFLPSRDKRFYLVKIDDHTLGVVLYAEYYWNPKLFELWMWKKGSWSQLYDTVFFYNVYRPLGLKDGRLLFLVGESDTVDDPKPLLVYDWVTKEMKELGIYDHSKSNWGGSLSIVSYVESQVVLPDGMSIGYYDDKASWNEYWRRLEADAK